MAILEQIGHVRYPVAYAVAPIIRYKNINSPSEFLFFNSEEEEPNNPPSVDSIVLYSTLGKNTTDESFGHPYRWRREPRGVP